jgi:hypothetical protein
LRSSGSRLRLGDPGHRRRRRVPDLVVGQEQALYIGVQGAAWNLGRVLVSGSLVSLTKILFDWAADG